MSKAIIVQGADTCPTKISIKMALGDFSHKLLAIFPKTSSPVEMWVTLHHRESRVFAMTWISTCPCSANAHLVLLMLT